MKNVQYCSSSRAIPQDSEIGFTEGGSVRARGMDAPIQHDNFNHPREMVLRKITGAARIN
ncbi:MAG TPA: hypothetical protein ENI08_01360 [Candidatus Dependentiae bacterium]|nr:hypothetical protein [Candidatus Dependentiae bacterium]